MRLFKQKETIFYATFNSETGNHDRMSYFKGNYTKKDFFDWVQKERKDIEVKRGQSTIITSMQIL